MAGRAGPGVVTTETVAERGVQTTISSWAIAIREAMANTLSGIFNTGIVLADCKAELPHGDWLEAVLRAGMSPRTAQRFLSIATNGALVEAALQGDIYVNATSVSHLPASWSTLYELSRIPTGDLIGSAHEIHPFMTHCEARALRQRIKDENQQRRPAPATTEPSDPELLKRATSLADEFVDGVRPSDINWTDKPLKSIWGDCRTWGGHIRINTQLRDAPEFVLDAVIVHELAHLLHPHHGKTFKAVADRYPRQLEAEAYLRGMSYARGAPTESGVRQVFVDGLLSALPEPADTLVESPNTTQVAEGRPPAETVGIVPQFDIAGASGAEVDGNLVADHHYFCTACNSFVGRDNAREEDQYECGECGDPFTREESADGDSNRCPNCNKFGAKADPKLVCPQCEDDLETTVEVVSDLLSNLADGMVNRLPLLPDEKDKDWGWRVPEMSTFLQMVAVLPSEVRGPLVTRLRTAHDRVGELLKVVSSA